MRKHLKTLLQASAGILAFAVVSAPAFAITMKAVYEGTVVSGVDQTNLFGHGDNALLDGLAYVLTFIYDTSTFGASRQTTADFDQIFGGTSLNCCPASPMLSAKLTIDGQSQILDGSYSGNITNFNSLGTAYASHDAQNSFSDSSNVIASFIYALARDDTLSVPLNLDTAFMLNLQPDFGNNSQFRFTNYDVALIDYTTNTRGFLSATSLTVSRFQQTSEVPAPAALPMLASGLGVFGLMAKRRAKKRAAT